MHQTNKWENVLLNDTMINTKNLQKNVISLEENCVFSTSVYNKILVARNILQLKSL
jgi:hypothetical protein